MRPYKCIVTGKTPSNRWARGCVRNTYVAAFTFPSNASPYSLLIHPHEMSSPPDVCVLTINSDIAGLCRCVLRPFSPNIQWICRLYDDIMSFKTSQRTSAGSYSVYVVYGSADQYLIHVYNVSGMLHYCIHLFRTEYSVSE